jgi:hypothetical protein
MSPTLEVRLVGCNPTKMVAKSFFAKLVTLGTRFMPGRAVISRQGSLNWVRGQ